MNSIQGNPKQGLTGATIGFFIGFAAVALIRPDRPADQGQPGTHPLMVAFLVAVPSLSGSLLRIPFSGLG